jgi:CSLREA domain-containing protein
MTRRTFAVLALLVLALAVGPVPSARAATFTVTKTADTADGTCNADCSLREGIIAANTTAGADVILVPPGTYLLTINMAGQDDVSAEGDLDITDDVTLTGAGVSTTVVDGNGAVLEDHVFQIKGPATATISGITVRGGNATFAGAGTRDDGGGIHADDDPSDATLVLSDTLVTANHADDFAGGVDVDGIATLTNVTIAGNTADFGAGGLEVEGTATLTNVTLSGNRAGAEGGGIAMYGTSLTINNSTITGNTADADNDDDGDGGGIFAGDPVVIRNTIIAGNTDASSPGTVHPDCSVGAPADLTSQGHNLVGTTPGGCSFTGAGEITGAAPQLTDLADHGGPTPTHALTTGSPAIDAGDPAVPGSGGTACASTDARGAARTGACDIGAYELVFCKGAVVNRLGTEGNDTLVGTTGPDGFLAFGGNDKVKGLGGKDTACLGPGKDIGAGGGGKDRLFGEQGKDRVKGQGGNDRLVGGPGKDTCVGGPGKKDRANCEVKKSVP